MSFAFRASKTMREDAARLRTSNSAGGLGVIRRIALGLSNAAVDLGNSATPNTGFNTKSFHQNFHGGIARLHACSLAKEPAIIGL